MRLLRDGDNGVRYVAIYSLSQVGGEGVRERLSQLYERAEEDEEIVVLEEALDNLDFTEGLPDFSLLEMDDEEGDLEEEVLEELSDIDDDDLFDYADDGEDPQD